MPAVGYISLVVIGIGWHFGFSSATVWTTKATMSLPTLKSEIQAANECFMFLISGAFIFATGYIYEAGSSLGSSSSPPVYGWKVLNYALLLPAGIMGIILLWVYVSPIDNNSDNSNKNKEQEGGEKVEPATKTSVSAQQQTLGGVDIESIESC